MRSTTATPATGCSRHKDLFSVVRRASAVINFTPAEGISSSYRSEIRDRVLTDEELTAVIITARRMALPYGLIVEFLALTVRGKKRWLSSNGMSSMRRPGRRPFRAHEPKPEGSYSSMLRNRPGR